MKGTFALLLLPVPCTPSSSPPGVLSLAKCKDQPKHHFFQQALLDLLCQCAYKSFCAHMVPRCPTVTGLSQDCHRSCGTLWLLWLLTGKVWSLPLHSSMQRTGVGRGRCRAWSSLLKRKGACLYLLLLPSLCLEGGCDGERSSNLFGPWEKRNMGTPGKVKLGAWESLTTSWSQFTSAISFL